jgi:SPP1 gp7 family putative phage head morphogenesis protein
MIRDKNRREIVLRPVRPNVGARAAYRRKLLALIDAMQASYERFLIAAYRNNEPEMAQDALPSTELKRALAKLTKRWNKQFDQAAEDLAAYFAKSAASRSDAQLKSILRKGGFSVKFKMTHAMRDVMNATIAENVSLIKSVPAEFQTQIEGLVMRGVTAGRDLQVISEGLQKQLGVAKRRAEFIARDQTNKMTASFTRVRQIELGITEAIWLHSHGGRTPRVSHVKNSGHRYDVDKGWYDPTVKQYIWPGILPNCRCVSRPIVKGFS